MPSPSQQETLPTSPKEWHRRVFNLTWPVILANVTIPLVGLVDTAVMGQLTEPKYIGAVAVGSQVFSAMYWLFGFLRMATTGLTAQAWGARDNHDIVRIAWRSTIVGLCLGAALVLLQIPISLTMLWLFEASDEVETLAQTYFTVRIWGAPALLLQMVMLGILFGLQRMRATLVISLAYNGLNIGLDLLFVLVFEWGVEGVALATVLSEWVSALLAVAAVLTTLKRFGWSPRYPQALWGDGVTRLFSVSSNLIIRSFFVQLPFFMVTLLSASLGDVVLATNAVLMQLFMLMAFGIDGFAHTAESLTGYAYGARSARGLRQAAWYSTVWGVMFAALISLSYALFGADIVATLSTSGEVRETADVYIWWLVVSPLIGIWAFLGDGIFIGTTHVRELRNCMIFSATVFLLSLPLLLETFGNHGLWASFTLFMVTRGIVLGVMYPRIEATAVARS